METERIINDLNELHFFAADFLKELPVLENAVTIIALHGDLGAGKTAFVQEIGRVLKVAEIITSPTFTIMRQYDVESEVFDMLVHIDAYRLESETELGPLKIAQLFEQPRTLVCIEWAERLGPALPQEAIHLSFSINEDEGRTIKIGRKPL